MWMTRGGRRSGATLGSMSSLVLFVSGTEVPRVEDPFCVILHLSILKLYTTHGIPIYFLS